MISNKEGMIFMYQLIIVDDEPITRNALKNFISQNCPDYIVSGIFSDGQEALDFLIRHPVDMVITDIRMPVMDGLALCRELNQRFRNCILVIISGYGDFEYAKKAIHYGVSNYLVKPIDFDELLDFLNASRERLELIHEEADTSLEDTELFFIDIMMGNLHEKEELKRRLLSLKLPAGLDTLPGAVLHLELISGHPSWKYGKERISNALLNTLRLSFTQYDIYLAVKTGNHFYFLSFRKDGTDIMLQPENIEKATLSNLGLRCRADYRYHFSGLYDFAAHKIPDKLLSPLSVIQEEGKKQSSDDVVIRKAMDYINANYAMDLTREDVANAVFLSSAYFSRFFKQKTGMSFSDYLTTVRMQKAIELLGTKMKINEISRKVGYQSRNRFFINFRQYTSYTPTEYRRQILQMDSFSDDSEENENRGN